MITSNELDAVEVESGNMFYVDPEGKYLGQYVLTAEQDLPEGAVQVPYAPEVGDQIWQFPEGPYGPSLSAAVTRENAWREAELASVPDQIAMIEDDDPAAVGTVEQWRTYRKALRLWVEGGPGFPFGTRPARPE